MVSILGYDFFADMINTFKPWILPVGVIVLLIIILLIARFFQKRAYEKNLGTIRR